MNENRLAVLVLFVAAIFWSTSGVLIKIVVLHPMAIAGWRSLIAGLVIMLLCRRSIKISWGINPLIAAGCMGIFCICFVIATKLTTAANAIILQSASSAYVAVLAPRMLGEPTRRDGIATESLARKHRGRGGLPHCARHGNPGVAADRSAVYCQQRVATPWQDADRYEPNWAAGSGSSRFISERR